MTEVRSMNWLGSGSLRPNDEERSYRIVFMSVSHTGHGGGPWGVSRDEQRIRHGFNLSVAPSQDVVSYF
jgi:hypothetical protein